MIDPSKPLTAVEKKAEREAADRIGPPGMPNSRSTLCHVGVSIARQCLREGMRDDGEHPHRPRGGETLEGWIEFWREFRAALSRAQQSS